jgi:Ankyrin repeats (3 copies)
VSKCQPLQPTLQCNLVVTEALDRNPGSGISVDIVAITGSGEHAGSTWTFRIDPSKHDAVKDKSKREHVSKGPKPKESAPVIPASTSVSKKTQAVTVVSEEPLVVARQKGAADKVTAKSQPLRAQAYQGQQVPWLEGPRSLQERLKGARILRFEYHGGLLSQQPLSLEVVTRELCYRLREQRREHPQRPIVFIGHDHGILVVAKTILALSSNHEDTAHGLFRHIAGLVILDPSHKSKLQVDDMLDDMLDNFVTEENKLFLRRGGPLFAELREQNHSTSLIKDFERVMYQASTHQPGILPARLHYNNQISDEGSAILEKFLVRLRESIKTILDLHFLLSAAAVGDDDALEKVLGGDASADVQNYAKRTALHLAVENGHKQTVRLLLGKYGADVALQDKEGSSAIHLAVRTGTDAEELIFLLLKKGADVYAENNEGNSALAIAKKNNLQKIISYLEHRPLVDGLSENPVELRARNPPGSDAKEACKRFRATIAEFFFIDNKEKYVLDQPSVYDLVYGDGPDKILNAARHTSVTQKPVCRWYHIPANNPAWMDDLFAKIGLFEDSLTEYQHDGRTPWSRFMIPQARRTKPRLYNDDLTR